MISMSKVMGGGAPAYMPSANPTFLIGAVVSGESTRMTRGANFRKIPDHIDAVHQPLPLEGNDGIVAPVVVGAHA
jgi:hypothetical protein